MEFWIASYPRAGNLYLRILLRNRYGIVSIPMPARNPIPRTFPNSEFFQPDYRDENTVAGIEGLKTHSPPDPNDSRPAVYIVRDGRESLVSYAHHALTFQYSCPPEEITHERVRAVIRELILETRSAYKTWSENVEAWAVHPNTMMLRFDELIADPARATDRAVASLGLNLPIVSEALPTFAVLQSAKPQHFRSGKRGEWQELFTPELHELFWKHNGSTMTRFGYPKNPPLKASA